VEDLDSSRDLYLNLIKHCLTRSLFDELYHQVEPPRGSSWWLFYSPIRTLLAHWQLQLVRRVSIEARTKGWDWPMGAETMIGHTRLDNLERCIVDVIKDRIPGDLIEAGVWRGGATILMRAVLTAYGETDRVVWVADSFEGLPRPDPVRYPADTGDRHWTWPQLAVSVDEVERNFARYGLLDDQVRFLTGWFRETLPKAPIERLAVLRVDADMYESTMEALTYLYPKLSPGGFVIIDDYGDVPGCRKAVDQFRAEHAITQEMHKIDATGVFWRRSESSSKPGVTDLSNSRDYSV
jgi:O-methyltransferase